MRRAGSRDCSNAFCSPRRLSLDALRRLLLKGRKNAGIHSFSRSLRENEPKEGRYPQGPLQRGMQFQNWENRNFENLIKVARTIIEPGCFYIKNLAGLFYGLCSRFAVFITKKRGEVRLPSSRKGSLPSLELNDISHGVQFRFHSDLNVDVLD